MRFKSSNLSIFILSCFVLTFFLTQHSTSQPDKMALNKKLLIAKGKSGLEYNVAMRVKDAFEQNGFSVEIVDLRHFDKQILTGFDVVLLMNAVKRATMSRKVQKAISAMSEQSNDRQPYMFIATISGEEWPQKQTLVDATTAASDATSAEAIAKKIIDRLESMLLPGEK